MHSIGFTCVLLACSSVAVPHAAQLIGAQDEPALSARTELTRDTLAHWREVVVPRAEELVWRDIPWRAEFAEAVQVAGEQDKPVLLWAMNGHPLACT